jgi:co-chaperonin GroES (HSP10)
MLQPLHDTIIISDMAFEEEYTQSGIYIPSQNGKVEGIKSRWGKVLFIGPEQFDVKVGQWICLEHGRWSRGIEYLDDNGEKIIIRKADNNAILLVSDEKPKGTV